MSLYKEFFHKTYKFCRDYNLLNENTKILAAVSGGPDSVLLFYFLVDLLKTNLIKSLRVVHFNHNLREESKDEEKFVENLCLEYGIKYDIIQLDVKKFSRENKLSIEIAGHILRDRYYKKLLEKYNYDVVATAHHKDDLVESVLYYLFKSAGLKGLAGISPKYKDYIIRPFLTIEKKEIYNILKELKLQYKLDKTNFETIYNRNKIRNIIIPSIESNFPFFKDNIYKTSEIARELHKFLKDNYNLDIDKDFWGLEYIKREKLIPNIAILYYQISDILKNWGLEEDNIGIYRTIFFALKKEKNTKITIDNNILLFLDYDGIRKYENYSKYVVEIKANKNFFTKLKVFYKNLEIKILFYNDKWFLEAYMDNYRTLIELKEDLFPYYIKTREEGMRFYNKNKKLKEFFIDYKIPRIHREFMPILVDKNNRVHSILFFKEYKKSLI